VDLTDGAMVTTVEGTDVTIDLSGATPRVNGANIIATDIVVGNGVIHLIDAVLTENADLVDVAMINGFSTLVDLVDEAGLVPTLRGDNGGAGFTVFAPTDAAFAALSAVPTGQALVDVLTYHVVGRRSRRVTSLTVRWLRPLKGARSPSTSVGRTLRSLTARTTWWVWSSPTCPLRTAWFTSSTGSCFQADPNP